MKKINFKKILGIAALCLGLNSFAVAQCNANYTYTVSGNGLVNFTNTSTGIISPISQQWHFGDGTVVNLSYTASPSQQISHTYANNGSYQVNLFISDSINACFDSTSQIITINNTINCNIVAGFLYNAGNGTGEINFTNTSNGTSLGNNPIYSWHFSDGSSSNLQNPSHIFNYNGTYSVSLNVSDSLGYCSDAEYQTISVTNGNICNLNVNYTYTLGNNGQVVFTNTSTGVDTSIDRITWNLGDGNYSDSTPNITHVYSYNGTYYVNLIIGDSTNICYSNRIDTITITNATMTPSCSANFTDSLFSNGTVLFVNQSFGTTANTVYSWYAYGATGNTSIENPLLTFSVNGTYTVGLTITDPSTGCSSSINHLIIISNVNSCLPTVSFIMHKDSLNPQPGVWEISPVYSSQVTSATWYWGDGSSSTGLYPTHTYVAAGQYNIGVTVFSNCGDSSTTYQNDSLYRLASNNSTNGANSIIQVTVVNATTGIKINNQETAQISLYPNPNAGLFTLNLTNVLAAKAQISISNILGEVVYTIHEQVSNNVLTKAIDLQNIVNGAYFMKIIVGEKVYTNKIIINK